MIPIGPPPPPPPPVAVHPTIVLRDGSGNRVGVMSEGVSFRESCGRCHDTEYIGKHDGHRGVAQLERTPPGGQSELDCARCHVSESERATPLTGAELSRALQRPADATCGGCHQTVHGSRAPLTRVAPASFLTGEVFSGQRIRESGLNLAGKDAARRSWDIHAERLVACVDCHGARNHPGRSEDPGSAPAHLRFEPRRPSIGEYLKRPSHELARSATGATLRRCTSCHDATQGHGFLPSPSRHLDSLACESCHVPRVPIGALAHLDATSVDKSGSPLRYFRGSPASPNDVTALQRGYTPVLLRRRDGDGKERYGPYNLITHSEWVVGAPPRPVTAAQLAAAYEVDPTLLAAFDTNGDGQLSVVERRLDRPGKIALMKQRLELAGAPGATIRHEVRPYGLHHGITGGEGALRECGECHGKDSRLRRGLAVAAWLPGGGGPPTVTGSEGVTLDGNVLARDGAYYYQPRRPRAGLGASYVFGSDGVWWVDWLGMAAILGVLAGAGGHGLARYLAGRKRGKGAKAVARADRDVAEVTP